MPTTIALAVLAAAAAQQTHALGHDENNFQWALIHGSANAQHIHKRIYQVDTLKIVFNVYLPFAPLLFPFASICKQLRALASIRAETCNVSE